MDKKWSINFINEKAETEILSLTADLQAKFLHVSDLIIEFGPHNVGLPHTRPLKDKLWEIRLKGKDSIVRCIYILAAQKKVIILHTFTKKTQQAPQRAIEIAQARMKELSND